MRPYLVVSRFSLLAALAIGASMFADHAVAQQTVSSCTTGTATGGGGSSSTTVCTSIQAGGGLSLVLDSMDMATIGQPGRGGVRPIPSLMLQRVRTPFLASLNSKRRRQTRVKQQQEMESCPGRIIVARVSPFAGRPGTLKPTRARERSQHFGWFPCPEAAYQPSQS